MPVLAGYGLIFAAFLAIVWLVPAFPVDNRLLAASFAAGFEAYFLLCGLSLFSGRPGSRPNWDGRFFFSFHRLLAFALLALVLAHAVLFIGAEPVALVYLTPAAPWDMLAGQMGAAAILFCAGSSFSLSAIKGMYTTVRHFDWTHRTFAATAIVLSTVHIIYARDHVRSRWTSALIAACAAGALAMPALRRRLTRGARVAGKLRARRRRVPETFPARLVLAFLVGCALLVVPLAISATP